ncbi:MAG: hypothetical protein Q9212_005020 [Teloschistes hypoglaucus]
MYATITLALSISSLFVVNTIAAPVGLPPNARDTITSTTSDIDTPAIALKPVRRTPEGAFGSLGDLVFPQKISPSPTSSTASSTFEFRIKHGKPTVTPASHESRDLVKKAQLGKPFGGLSDLSFPQKVSASSSSAPAPTATSADAIGNTGSISFDSRDLTKKAQPGKPFGGLSDLSFPQKVSASSSSAPAPTATSANAIGNAGSISFDSRDLVKKAPEASSPDDPFGGLDELSFPQKISASASTTSAAPTASASIGVPSAPAFEKGSVSAEYRPSFPMGADVPADHDLDHKIRYTDTMSYEVEHNIPKNEQAASQHTRRPDLSTFFSNLELVNTSNTQNSNATPMPADMRAVFITLSDAFRSMRSQGGGALLDILIESLEAEAEAPPREVEGISDSFLDELDRVPKKTIKKADSCPICGNPFLDGTLISSPSYFFPLTRTSDQYPLVVRLPCHKDHFFDLECIAPWLKLHATCPLDRKNLLKKKEPPPPPKDEEEDGEWDDMFA